MQFLTLSHFLSRFLRNKRDISLSLHLDNEIIMNVTKEIRRRIVGFSEDYVFTASDFDNSPLKI